MTADIKQISILLMSLVGRKCNHMLLLLHLRSIAHTDFITLRETKNGGSKEKRLIRTRCIVSCENGKQHTNTFTGIQWNL